MCGYSISQFLRKYVAIFWMWLHQGHRSYRTSWKSFNSLLSFQWLTISHFLCDQNDPDLLRLSLFMIITQKFICYFKVLQEQAFKFWVYNWLILYRNPRSLDLACPSLSFCGSQSGSPLSPSDPYSVQKFAGYRATESSTLLSSALKCEAQKKWVSPLVWLSPVISPLKVLANSSTGLSQGAEHFCILAYCLCVFAFNRVSLPAL